MLQSTCVFFGRELRVWSATNKQETRSMKVVVVQPSISFYKLNKCGNEKCVCAPKTADGISLVFLL